MVTLYRRLRAKLSILTQILMLRLRFRLRMIQLAFTLQPITGADGSTDGGGDGDTDGDGDGDGDADSGGDSDDDDDADADDGGDDDGDKKPAPKGQDWRRMSRKHEREAKRARKERDDLKNQLAARNDKDKSEQEKATEQAVNDATKGIKAQHQKERQHDRLEVATTRIAAKGVKVGDGDDAKTVKFADPDDAMVYLERDIANGDLDAEDIFDDNGRVRSDQLQEALSDLLDRKPHLGARSSSDRDDDTSGNGAGDGFGRRKPRGSADAGKGTPQSGEESSVDDHLKKIRRNPQGAKAA